MRVGFVGLGSMGGDQARCLVAGKFDLTVFDVYAPAREAFAQTARVASSVAEVGRNADIVGVCVRDDKQVRETLEGPDGLLASMKAGSIILIHSTIDPETVIDLAKHAKERGIELLDATVTRTKMDGAGPFVALMIGGSEAALEKARPVINAYATDVFYAGGQGAGAAMKIINNLVTWTSITTAAQAFRLAAGNGVKLDVLHALMTSNGNFTRAAGAFSYKFMGGEMDREFMESQLGIGQKDLSLAEELAKKANLDIPAAAATRAYLPSAMLDKG